MKWRKYNSWFGKGKKSGSAKPINGISSSQQEINKQYKNKSCTDLIQLKIIHSRMFRQSNNDELILCMFRACLTTTK